MSQVRMSKTKHRLEEACSFLHHNKAMMMNTVKQLRMLLSLLLQVCTMFKSAEDLVYKIQL